MVQTYIRRKDLLTCFCILLFDRLWIHWRGVAYVQMDYKKHAMDIQEAFMLVIAHGGDNFP